MLWFFEKVIMVGENTISNIVSRRGYFVGGGTPMSVEHIRKKVSVSRCALSMCNRGQDGAWKKCEYREAEDRCYLYGNITFVEVLAVLAEQRRHLHDLWKKKPDKSKFYLPADFRAYSSALERWIKDLERGLGVVEEATHPP